MKGGKPLVEKLSIVTVYSILSSVALKLDGNFSCFRLKMILF